MICKIADLYVDIPASGDLVSRCRDYLTTDEKEVNITIDPDLFKPETKPHLSFDDSVYLDSGWQFYRRLISYEGLLLHASAVELDGYAYLFSAPSGTGKSTHTRLWQDIHGESAVVFNDDKPALRNIDGVWYAYGTPWCGKDGINVNIKTKLGGICFLKQANENKIRRLSNREAISNILSQTLHRISDPIALSSLLTLVDKLVTEIPIYLLENKPEMEAAIMSYEMMLQGIKEAEL